MSEKADYGSKSSREFPSKAIESPSSHRTISDLQNEPQSYGPFADFIRELREERGYSQKQVAQSLDLSPAAYGYYERGERNPSPAMLASLSLLYNVNVLTLMKYAVEAEKPCIAEQFVRDIEEYTSGISAPLSTGYDSTRILVSTDEHKLLEHYRVQPPAVKQYINKIVKNV